MELRHLGGKEKFDFDPLAWTPPIPPGMSVIACFRQLSIDVLSVVDRLTQ